MFARYDCLIIVALRYDCLLVYVRYDCLITFALRYDCLLMFARYDCLMMFSRAEGAVNAGGGIGRALLLCWVLPLSSICPA